jgi:hypothetical protein
LRENHHLNLTDAKELSEAGQLGAFKNLEIVAVAEISQSYIVEV